MPDVKMQIVGLEDFLKDVANDKMLLYPYRRAMEQGAKIGARAAKRSSPERRGKLLKSIKGKVHKKDPPRYLVIKATATRKTKNAGSGRKSPNPFPYARALNYGEKYGKVGWFTTDGVEANYPEITGEIERVLDLTAMFWRRR